MLCSATSVAVPDAERAFDRLFRLVVATTAADEADAFAVRYRVYCEEFQDYEPKTAFPDRLERTPDDAHSTHIVVRRRGDGAAVAAARLVRPDPAAPGRPLPCEVACGASFAPAAVGCSRSIAEISRVCILGHVRMPTTARPDEERHAAPVMTSALILTCFALARLAQIEAVYGLMEERFAYLCRRKGMESIPVGPAVRFHGQRIPFRVGPGTSRERMPLIAALADVAAVRARHARAATGPRA